MATKITTPELFNLSSNNTAATQLPVFTTSTRPTPTTSTVQVEYLVIGGGGAGGAWGGGGGAGGYLTNYGGSKTPLTSSVNYAIVVGEGGIKQADSGSRIAANAGEDSSIIGTGISVVANGGGGGGGMLSTSTTAEYPAQNGGSGGGASSMRNASVGGSGNTPSTTPSQGNDGGDSPAQDPNYPGGGGGGGAGSLGGDGQNSSGNYSPGNGGNGLASSITGTSVTRAGGGGGFLYGGPNIATDGGISTGGTGGGGAGGRYVSPSNGSLSSFSNAIDGEVNTGSGGGSGSANPYQSGSIKYGGSTASGGSGIVILRYPTNSSPVIKTTGGLVYTKSTDGSDTVIQFTEGSGNVSFASAGIAIGEMIFNSTTGKVEYWDGFQWNMIKDEPVLNIDIFNDNSCIAYYRFNGNANDETGNYNATASNETYSATGGKEGGYISLPQNSSGIINTNDSGALAPGGTNVRSYSIWVKFQETGQADAIWSQWRSNPTPRSTAFWITNRSDGKIEVVNYRSNSSSDYRRTLTTSTFTALNSWYNIVVSIGQSNAVTIWVNGTQAATTGSGNIGTINNITNPNTTIGSLSNPNTGTYGIFDEARVFNRALTNAEALILSNEF